MPHEGGKDKDHDPDPWFYPTRLIAVSPQQHADEWFHWFVSMPIAEYREISRHIVNVLFTLTQITDKR